MTTGAVVIGLGNVYRRDDGIGPRVAAACRRCVPAAVRVVTEVGDPAVLLNAWTGASLAVVIDAAVARPSQPGRIRRYTASDFTGPDVAVGVSSHGLDLARVYALGRAVGVIPAELVVFTVDAADTGYGVGLTPAVAAALPEVTARVIAEIAPRRTA